MWSASKMDKFYTTNIGMKVTHDLSIKICNIISKPVRLIVFIGVHDSLSRHICQSANYIDVSYNISFSNLQTQISEISHDVADIVIVQHTYEHMNQHIKNINNILEPILTKNGRIIAILPNLFSIWNWTNNPFGHCTGFYYHNLWKFNNNNMSVINVHRAIHFSPKNDSISEYLASIVPGLFLIEIGKDNPHHISTFDMEAKLS